jgi:hypothetical protein
MNGQWRSLEDADFPLFAASLGSCEIYLPATQLSSGLRQTSGGFSNATETLADNHAFS